ncbi:hypothetical protein [Bifidobacterium tibiigranuli]|jgi:hypothetical protein|uniref:hypothetical protein n=1 Tax=Bifidobacterium tibiigranuli TaxID=2172043 RepID=UPI002356627C|nr:hypothetical protein [Bifidobacterium tibiigranuli]MCI1212218.1 hypothetical protein [Bifidobacterium tibiigranuli]MCI1222101.1 hypothetical protein [Bifidobacterium tibiigranuli]
MATSKKRTAPTTWALSADDVSLFAVDGFTADDLSPKTKQEYDEKGERTGNRVVDNAYGDPIYLLPGVIIRDCNGRSVNSAKVYVRHPSVPEVAQETALLPVGKVLMREFAMENMVTQIVLDDVEVA